MDFTTVEKNLKERGFKVSAFATAKEAADYLNAQIDGESVSFGGSMTLSQMGLFESLGFDVTALKDKGRKLILPIPGQNIEVVLAKAADVIT